MLAASLNRMSNAAALVSNLLGAHPSPSSSSLASSEGGTLSLEERIALALVASTAASAYRGRLRSGVEAAVADSDDDDEEGEEDARGGGGGAWGSMMRGGGTGGSSPLMAAPRQPPAAEGSRQGLRARSEALELLQAARAGGGGGAAAGGRPAALLELEAARDGLRAGLAQREAERAMVMQVGGVWGGEWEVEQARSCRRGGRWVTTGREQFILQ